MNIEIIFYGDKPVQDNQLKFAVIMAKYKGKWILSKHKERTTWEIPGGRREREESIDNTAKRELKEETGAQKFNIKPVSVYSVKREEESFGKLYYAEVQKLGKLPDLEIGEIKLFDQLPSNLTYPQIQPQLFKKVANN
ncbi:NUDIX domain-containing protein [Proteinivorax tanatarense]|uniref:NUDIX domain-containing protein n=1 Tax=Proteinivorax tanatarense TaxID=1260629 RepID=A0AAU7VMW1_9FIRM